MFFSIKLDHPSHTSNRLDYSVLTSHCVHRSKSNAAISADMLDSCLRSKKALAWPTSVLRNPTARQSLISSILSVKVKHVSHNSFISSNVNNECASFRNRKSSAIDFNAKSAAEVTASHVQRGWVRSFGLGGDEDLDMDVGGEDVVADTVVDDDDDDVDSFGNMSCARQR
jgi:hypothetical protein